MYTEAGRCEARMNHPHGQAKPNTVAAFYPPDVVQLSVAGLKAEQDRAVCCEELSEELGVRGPWMWGCGTAMARYRHTPENRASRTVNCLW